MSSLDAISWFDAFVVVDFETTGIGDDARAVEIALVRFEHGVEVEFCNYVLKPLTNSRQPYASRDATQDVVAPLPPEALKISGLTEEEIHAAPEFVSVWPAIGSMFGGAVPMAYNAPFDKRFLMKELAHAGYLPPWWLKFGAQWIDPLLFVKKLDGPWKAKLTDVCKRRNVSLGQAHRAVDDARATGHLWLKLGQDADLAMIWAEQMTLRHRSELDYQKYKAKKDGKAKLTGDVYTCDVCFQTGWSEIAGQPPAAWGMVSVLKPKQLECFGSETIVTCSATCNAQFAQWAATLA